MCGRYALYSSADDLVEIFRVVGGFDWPVARYNIAPTQPAPVILPDHRAATMKWGLVPSWSRDGKPFINARGEGLFEKGGFRAAATQRRCLVPTDGFYEWRREGKQKQPLLFRRADHRPFVMAGIWEPSREGLPGYAVVTCGPNALVEGIHDRMPVILRAEDADRWLAGDDAAALLVPCDAAAMEAVALGPRVNDVKNDDPGCIEPAPTTLSLPWRT